MKNLIKKLVSVFLICVSLIGITSCNNTNTGEPTGDDVNYPLMDYFENKVYAMKYRPQDLNYAFDNSTFKAIGSTTMDNIINKDVYDFGGNYAGLVFTAKTGVEVESVSFTIISEEDVIISLGFYGGYIKEDGSFGKVQHDACYEYANVEIGGNRKRIQLKANTPMEIVLTTYREKGSITEDTEAIDFGKITKEFDKNPVYKRFLLRIAPVKFASNGLVDGSYPYTVEEFEALKCKIRIYNVNFKCKKID